MKTLKQMLLMAGIAGALGLSAGNLVAQPGPGGPGGRNFDPAQFRERMMENVRERLEVKNDDEWKAIEPLIGKVMDARRDVGVGGMGMFGRGGPRRGGGNNDAQANGNNDQRGRRRFGGEPSPEAEDLQKAVDSNAPKDELKAKLAKFREARKENQAKLEKAQEELGKVLTVKQEATAALMGLVQ